MEPMSQSSQSDAPSLTWSVAHCIDGARLGRVGSTRTCARLLFSSVGCSRSSPMLSPARFSTRPRQLRSALMEGVCFHKASGYPDSQEPAGINPGRLRAMHTVL